MKKTYSLRVEGKHPERLLEAIKYEIRKYIKREQGKPLPKGADIWDFDCRIGLTPDDAKNTHPAEINLAINELVQGGATAFYVELQAKPALRRPRTAPQVIPRNDESGGAELS
ncbi:DUF6172 family protein [Roseateles koreensis]|uniref:DUF6172 family protein n=1 Tax=Roseateles koreensis TaxID=2987526 RepID=A0ABT5KUD6_9BURK|nr:DUF6172 family protein [Roseateles koreensis]MDC8786050.1 DUF6172 family protein [Roseateles koreensis]